MSKKDRRNGDRHERRNGQADEEFLGRTGEGDQQESDSLAALKAILSKVAALLQPLQLTSEEAIGLVERLYGGVLDADIRLAGETDDTRKASVLAYVRETVIRREGDSLVVEFPTSTTAYDSIEATPHSGNDSKPSIETRPAEETTSPVDTAEKPSAEPTSFPLPDSSSPPETTSPGAEDSTVSTADGQPE